VHLATIERLIPHSVLHEDFVIVGINNASKSACPCARVTKRWTNNANPKHSNCCQSDTSCLLNLTSAESPSRSPVRHRLLATCHRQFLPRTMVGVIVHHGETRSTVDVIFPRRGLDAGKGTDRDNWYNCKLPTTGASNLTQRRI
jgi:hypothetical protein